MKAYQEDLNIFYEKFEDLLCEREHRKQVDKLVLEFAQKHELEPPRHLLKK